MDFCATVGADDQPLKVMQSGEGALDHAPQPGAVLSVSRWAMTGLLPRSRTSRRYLSWS